MAYVHNLEDTICALSTPPGTGGIAVLRVSGPQSLSIGRTLCPKLPENIPTHTVHLAKLLDPASGAVVDEVLVTYFAHGKSYTGQETLEISCHGGPAVVNSILQILTRSGARLAEKGEFTFRAYMNGKVDLVQAEAVLDLIHSGTSAAARVASRQLQGELSLKYKEIESGLLWALTQMEAQIDFSTEDIQPVQSDHVNRHLTTLDTLITQLLDTYAKGRALREGVQLVLAGEPNVGKSSLFNRILGRDQAIVTDIEGTTRDVLEGRMVWRDYPVVVKDTAGLRQSDDLVESLGIQRAQEAVREADWTLVVIHGPDFVSSQGHLPDYFDYSSDQVLVLVNQVDLLEASERELVLKKASDLKVPSERVRLVSAKSGEGVREALDELLKKVNPQANAGEEVYINLRHFEALSKVRERLVSACQLLESEDSPELVSFELQDGLRLVHGLLGKEFYEQIIDQIFKEFCLGK